MDPGVFTPTPTAGIATSAGAPPALTAADITTQKIAFDERKRLFNECQAVENALRHQIIEAIDSDYLRPLRNDITDTITSSIPTIFDFLRNNYGKLHLLSLNKWKVRLMISSTIQPLRLIPFSIKIDDFQDVCVLTSNAKSDTQLVNMAYLIFQKSGIFMNSLREWNKKTPADKTYVNMKSFMRNEYLQLQEVGGLTIQNSMTNQANLV